MNKHNKAIIKASGLCLTDLLTEELLAGREDELDVFISEHAWEVYENYDAAFIWSRILEIAEAIEVGVG